MFHIKILCAFHVFPIQATCLAYVTCFNYTNSTRWATQITGFLNIYCTPFAHYVNSLSAYISPGLIFQILVIRRSPMELCYHCTRTKMLVNCCKTFLWHLEAHLLVFMKVCQGTSRLMGELTPWNTCCQRNISSRWPQAELLPYCHVYVWLQTGFGLDIRFIDHLQVVTINNYNTIAISTLYSSLEHTV
jgi:hypothetical protein